MFHVNVEGAVNREGKWLIIERSLKEGHAGGLLSLVGGTVEKGISTNLLERNLRRELFEEVGVMVKEKMDYVRNTSFKLEDGSEVIDIVFLCEFKEGEPFAKSPDEVDSVYWMTTEDIVNHPKAPIWLIDSIKEAEALLIGL
ncbi:NUDIX hydrolase [Bacillus timonensis]|uniref:NUDIX hydrolase n=1 Tax=Bacillus timonensis TaxID=1033734 RepID=UPI0002886CFC|nr:NUDIX domain-containing protein [Bacillus timonensis]